MIKIDSKIPEGPVAEKWTNYKAHQKLVNPANKRRLDIIVCLLYTSQPSYILSRICQFRETGQVLPAIISMNIRSIIALSTKEAIIK